MLKIKNEQVKRLAGDTFDYELENGALLHQTEWNGERYTVRTKGQETTYTPVTVGEADEDGDYAEYTTIGFEASV